MAIYNKPFYMDRPIFVKQPFNAVGRDYGIGDEFDWQSLGVDPNTVQTLLNNDYLLHRDDVTSFSREVNDLETKTLDELMSITDCYNDVVAKHTTNKTEFTKLKCKKVTGKGETSRQNQIRNIKRFHNSSAAKFLTM